MLFTFLQNEVAGAVAAPLQEESSFSLIGMAAKGGWLMIVLAMLSIAAIYIFAERLYAINKAKKIDNAFMKDIRDYIFAGKLRSAKALCKRADNAIARMVGRGVDKVDKPVAEIQTTMENVATIEVAKLEKGLPALATIAGGAPMIGFLGTVSGMIKAFFNMSQAGNNIDITLLSSGIYEAMITTVGGLIVGILAYFAYNYLTSCVNGVVSKMETATVIFLDIVQARNDKPAEE